MCERFWKRSTLQLLMLTGGNAIITETHPISDLLQKLAQILGSLSDAFLSIEQSELAKPVCEAADALEAMADEVGKGDLEVAWEIARSSARLVTTLKSILNQQAQSRTMH
jgi:hypothetical protein